MALITSVRLTLLPLAILAISCVAADALAAPPATVDRPSAIHRPTTEQLGNLLGLPPAPRGNRSAWQTAGATNLAQVSDRWSRAISEPARLNRWDETHAERWTELQAWADGVRNDWQQSRKGLFDDAWWQQHAVSADWWHYRHGAYQPWVYWWSAPTWGALTTWLAPLGAWGDGCYYDFGTGGNVAYEDRQVTVDGWPVGTPEELSQSAAELATVTPPTRGDQTAETQWMALGTFALSPNQNDTGPARVLQLAIDQQGIVSGTLYDFEQRKLRVLQGRVDRESQRVAFNNVDEPTIVYETGLYDLLQPYASVLTHYGLGLNEDVLLVRLDPPTEENESTSP